MNRVVITGMGIWSCIGTSLDEVRDALYNGTSGIICSPERKVAGYRSPLIGNVPTPDLKPYLSRNQRIYISEEVKYAYMATRQALENAGIDQDFLCREDVGVIYGNDTTMGAAKESLEKFIHIGSTAACGGGATFQTMNSTVTMNLACLFHLKGINLTTSAACASGSHSIGLATLLIRNGLQNCIVCGGAEEANIYSVASFDGMQAFSTRTDTPEQACRPFDRDRDGLVPSGGAATIVLESYDHAVKRGATILAEVLGWGFSGNGNSLSAPEVEGPVKALEHCIKDAAIDIRDIGYINAHGTSTILGDQREAQAIAQVFPKPSFLNSPLELSRFHKAMRLKEPFTTSTKSQTGHEMWMAGTSEVIYSILMMKNDFIAGNINFNKPDDITACLNILPETKGIHFDTFLSNSFGFGGTNSALIITNYK